jgi:hypothetical protein
MSDIIGVRNAGDLARRMINNMHDTAANMGKCAYVPTAEDIKSLYDGNTGDYNKAFYTGNFLMLMKMLDKETSRDFVYRVVNTVHERHNVCDLFDLIMTRAIDMIDIAHDYDVAKFIVSYAFNLGSPRVINAISSKKNIDERLNQFIATFKKREVKTTEMWVRNNDGVYIVEGINEEAIAHAPRRR